MFTLKVSHIFASKFWEVSPTVLKNNTLTSFRCPNTKNLVDHIPIMGRFCIDTIRKMGFPWGPIFHRNARPDNAQSYNGMTWPSTCFDEEEVGFIDCCMRLGCRENLVFGHEVV